MRRELCSTVCESLFVWDGNILFLCNVFRVPSIFRSKPVNEPLFREGEG